MKKAIIISLVLILVLSVFAGCRKDDNQQNINNNSDTTESQSSIYDDIGDPSTASGGVSEKIPIKTADPSATPRPANMDDEP